MEDKINKPEKRRMANHSLATIHKIQDCQLYTSKKLDFNIESRLLIRMITEDDFLKNIIPIYQSSYLTNSFSKTVAQWCIKHFNSHKKAPKSNISAIFERHLKAGDIHEDMDLIKTFLEKLDKKYLENEWQEKDFDLGFALEEAQNYFQERALKVKADNLTQALDAGRLEQAKEIEETFKLPIIGMQNDNSGVFLANDFPTLELPERQTIVDPFLKEGGLGYFNGEKGTGKTNLILEMAYSITSKEKFGPWNIAENVPCAYLDGELSVDDLWERWAQTCPSGITEKDFLIISNDYLTTQGKSPVNILEDTSRQWLLKMFIDRGIKLVFLDNLGCLAPGIDENAKKDYDPVNQFLLELRRNRIAAVMAHHTGKSGTQRGTSAREDNIDFSIMLKRPNGYEASEGARFELSFNKARVKNEDLEKLRRVEAHWLVNSAGAYFWEWSNPGVDKLEILKMLGDGLPVKEIAKSQGVTPQYIYDLRKTFMGNGWYDGKELSQEGRERLNRC